MALINAAQAAERTKEVLEVTEKENWERIEALINAAIDKGDYAVNIDKTIISISAKNALELMLYTVTNFGPDKYRVCWAPKQHAGMPGVFDHMYRAKDVSELGEPVNRR